MTSPSWITPAGFLGTLTERVTTLLSLSATGTNLTYSLIAGHLPKGLSLNTSTGVILGTPLSVSSDINNTFVIRIENTEGINDRTFTLTVKGPTNPTWATPSGLLPVGINGELYAINKEYIDYTVRADTDILNTGNTLKYYILDNQGQLPPGLTLITSGRIYGYINDSLTLDDQASASGGYDTNVYDRYPYDYGNVNPLEISKPETISKTYQFYITVTDGIASSKQLFSIEVVDPNSQRTDNNFIRVDTNRFDTSISYLLPPLWQSQYGSLLPQVANLGMIRASRPQIISLHEYDPYPLVGPIYWDWSTTVNPEIKLLSDSQINEFGYQTKNLKGDTAIYFKNSSLFPVTGMQIQLNDYVPGFDSTTYTITGVVQLTNTSGYLNIDRPLPINQNIPDSTIFYVGSPSVHPYGLSLDPNSGELYGNIPYQPAYSKTYKFTVQIIKTDLQTGNTVKTSQMFTLTVRGDIQSYIRFISSGTIGTLLPGQISELSIVAENINSNYNVEYTLIGGKLPKGLTLYNDGTIQGRALYGTQTTFDFTLTNSLTAFELDENTTTIDKLWYFTVRANDVYKLSAVDQTFSIEINETSATKYTRIFLKPFMSLANRSIYSDFTSNATIFDPTILYRPSDPEFGVQNYIQMVIETGIQQVDINDYAEAMQTYFHRKRFYFGDIKSISAQDSNGNIIYELIYVDIIDDQMSGNYSPSYASSVANMQNQLETIQLDSNTVISVDERLQPRYMTTIQSDTGIPLGFIKAVPICYVLPGNSAKVLSRIKNNGFDFKQFDFDTDRIIIESPLNSTQSNWLFYPTGK